MSDADINSFHSLITRLEGGALNDELTELVRKCVREISDACNDRGGTHKASLKLNLEFKMDQKDKVCEIQASVDEKMPKTPRGRAGMFYVTADGRLSRENPRQMSFDDELERRRQQQRDEGASVHNA